LNGRRCLIQDCPDLVVVVRRFNLGIVQKAVNVDITAGLDPSSSNLRVNVFLYDNAVGRHSVSDGFPV